MPRVATPATEGELLARAESLAGMRLAEISVTAGRPVPEDLRRAKGWAGALLEDALGATAGSRDVPDFPELGIELKTIPVSPRGIPRESTFVCTIDLLHIGDTEWAASRVARKLARVLWVPIDGDRKAPVDTRRVGAPFLWSPSPEQEAALRADWEELAGIVGMGGIERVTAHFGRHLQIRPKAATGRSRQRTMDAEGRAVDTLPRGFYLRATFTARLLAERFG